MRTISKRGDDQHQADTNQVLNDALDLARAAGERGAEGGSIVLGLVSAAVAIAKHNGRSTDVVKAAVDVADRVMKQVPADPRDSIKKN
jgi:hypothetical protein